MNPLNSKLSNHFNQKKVVKVIAGLKNTNIAQIVKIAQAAELADASYIDVCANTKIVKVLKSVSCLPICISSIEPVDIYNCVAAGADMIEVGNYDSFYDRGIYISSNHIIKLVKEIKNLVNDTLICVTIPYYLNLDDQVSLAQSLESLGVDILQTEGLYSSSSCRNLSNNCNNFSQLSCSNTLSTSFLSTQIITKSVKLPVITASGVTDIFTSCSNLFGASGVGIGSSVCNRRSLIEMTKYISQVKNMLFNSKKCAPIYLVNS